MVDPQMERVTRHLTRLKLVATRERLDGLLQEAARKELGYMDFLDLMLSEEAQSKDLKRTRMGIQIAHFPVVRRLEDFDFSFQPSIDQKLIRELETGRFIANGENVLLLGPPGGGKTHLASGLGRKVIELAASALFVPALGLVAQLMGAESEGHLEERLAHLTKLIIDDLSYLPFERRAPGHASLPERHLESEAIRGLLTLRRLGWGIKRIARNTVRDWLRDGVGRQYSGPVRSPLLAEHLPWLREPFLAGVRNGNVLRPELAARRVEWWPAFGL